MIREATSPADIEAARALFRAYAESTDAPMCFRSFEAELAGLPGDYRRPRGRLLLACHGNGQAFGCVAVKEASEEKATAEMKRLYIRADYRGRGIGRALALAAIAAAREAGYRRIRLETLPSMTEACALYRELGFLPEGTGASGIERLGLSLV